MKQLKKAIALIGITTAMSLSMTTSSQAGMGVQDMSDFVRVDSGLMTGQPNLQQVPHLTRSLNKLHLQFRLAFLQPAQLHPRFDYGASWGIGQNIVDSNDFLQFRRNMERVSLLIRSGTLPKYSGSLVTSATVATE